MTVAYWESGIMAPSLLLEEGTGGSDGSEKGGEKTQLEQSESPSRGFTLFLLQLLQLINAKIFTNGVNSDGEVEIWKAVS